MGFPEPPRAEPPHDRRLIPRRAARFELARERLSGEGGFALVIAIGMMLVLSIALTSVIGYSKASSNNANFSKSGQNAYALAEAGLNNALSILAIKRADTTAMAPQPDNAGDTNSTVTTYQGGGTATWGGSFDEPTKTWTIKSIGSTPNPTGPSANDVTRTLWTTVQIPPPPYSFVSLNTLCDKHTLTVRSSGQLTITNATYVDSCDMGHDAFDVFGTGGNITAPSIQVVGGWETHTGNTVTVGGTTCPLLNANPPALGTPGTPTVGCPTMGQPVLGDPFANVKAPSLGNPACPTPAYGAAASYSPKLFLKNSITATQTTLVVKTATPTIDDGELILLGTEKLYVVSGGGTVNLTVQRGALGSLAASHVKDTVEIKKIPVTGTKGTAALPASCSVPSGTVTLDPGTYYGGICIGVATGAECGNKVGGSCPTTSTATANVTLGTGTYTMAGGGFFVCGSSTLSAPKVLIYNTQDPTVSTGAGAIDQILLNTTGSVSLHPQTRGTYAGLTIFQDRTLGVIGSGTSCDTKGKDGKTATALQQADIGLGSMASTGANGPLGSLSGTIYSPSSRSIYSDFVGGTANLAVMTSCILIDGGNSTYDFHPEGLFGVELTVDHVWG